MKQHLPAGLPPVAGKRYHLDGTAPFRRLVVPSCLDANAAALFYPGFRGDSWMDVSPVRDGNADLQIQTPASHGIRGLVNVFGMDARSETSIALALADAIIDGLAERSQKSVHSMVTNRAGKLIMA